MNKKGEIKKIEEQLWLLSNLNIKKVKSNFQRLMTECFWYLFSFDF